MGRRIVGGALLAMLALTTPAMAATDRYAAPGGAGTTCSSPAPCSLATAVSGVGAAAGDTVHVAGGDYFVSTGGTISVIHPNKTIQGPSSGPRAHIRATDATALLVDASGLRLRDLDLTTHDGGGSSRPLSVNQLHTGLVAERLRITGTGTTAAGALMQGGATNVLRDSLVTVASVGGTAILGGGTGSTIVNVTAKAPNGLGLWALQDYMSNGQTQQVTVVNSILEGDTWDIDVEGGSMRHIRVDIDHSNWQTEQIGPVESELVEGAGNQTAAPTLAGDDVTQIAGSPTIDAGRTLAQLGTRDLFNGVRSSGSAPDIGAHEVQELPPVISSEPPVTDPPPPGTDMGTPVARDTIAPAFTALSMSSRRFRAARGTTFRWTLSEPATVTIAFERRLAGLRVRRQGRLRCLRATAKLKRSLSGKRQRRCTIFRPAGTLRRAAPAGPTALKFAGRIGSRALPAAAYRATVTATDAAANRSPVRRLSFTIVRR